MPKKSGGKASRARASRPARQSARPSAVVPFDSAPVVAPPIGTPGVTGSSVGSAYAPRATSPSRTPSRSYRAPRAGSLIPITDYSYVMADLKRIGVLAAVAFVILAGLTFVIH